MPNNIDEKQIRRQSIVTHLKSAKKNGIKRVLKSNKTLSDILERPAMNDDVALKTLTNNSPTDTSACDSLSALQNYIGDCKRCKLCAGRTNIVFGEGNPNATLMLIGEAPGADEDESGRPFVGRAGQLLTKIIESMGLKREDIYIANILKCRPPENRAPEPDESLACMPFLKKQVELVNLKIIMCLGKSATQTLLSTETAISKLRGVFVEMDGRQVMPTYHPAYLLRNPEMKKFVWEDCLKVMEKLGMKIPTKQ